MDKCSCTVTYLLDWTDRNGVIAFHVLDIVL